MDLVFAKLPGQLWRARSQGHHVAQFVNERTGCHTAALGVPLQRLQNLCLGLHYMYY